MFNTIVAATDGRRGRGAAALGHVLAGASGARLLLVAVEVPLVAGYPELRADLASDLRSAHDELAPDARTQIVIDISPARALRRIAQEEQADLVVVGSRQPGALRRLASGDTAMQVLHSAPCAVAVAPDQVPPSRELQTIGVGINGTAEARAALDVACELAQRSGAEVRLLAVAGNAYPGSANLVTDASYTEMYADIIERRVRTAREAVEESLAACADATAAGDVRIGDPIDELVALSSKCDLLVLGSRHWGLVRRLVLGSTSEPVIRHAQCPVLVVPRHGESEHDEPRDSEHSMVIF